jgi:superfamily II DNA/RNA helicase
VAPRVRHELRRADGRVATTEKVYPLTKFSDLGLAAPILQALQGQGYCMPTPIQAKAIPIVLTGRDVLGIAQTGTGKTAAFALPIIHRLTTDRRQAPPKGCRVLVLSPTRELATQIAEAFAPTAGISASPSQWCSVVSATVRNPKPWRAAWTCWLRHPAGSSITSPSAASYLQARKPSCSTRPIRCWTSDSCRPSAALFRTLRGIDVDHVTHVVNYELPDVPECYVHHIGRTARAGAAGIAISLCDAEERNLLRDIERLTRQAIPAEDRREEAGRLSDRPARGGPTSGHAGGQANRAANAHRGWPRRTGRRQPSPRAHQRQGSASNHVRSPTAGPGRHHPRKQSAHKGDSA